MVLVHMGSPPFPALTSFNMAVSESRNLDSRHLCDFDLCWFQPGLLIWYRFSTGSILVLKCPPNTAGVGRAICCSRMFAFLNREAASAGVY